MSKYDEVLEKIAAEVIKKMETVGGSWAKSWVSSGNGLHVQATNQTPYKGLNQIILMFEADDNGFDSSEWATYKTWEAAGSQVRKGEHGVTLVRWIEKKCKDHGADVVCSVCLGGAPLIPVTFTVFNSEQCDHTTWEKHQEMPPIGDDNERIAEIDEWISALGVTLRHGGDRAYFRPATDHVQMPEITDFFSAGQYYSVLFHEITHWSGGAKRLNRVTPAKFGSEAYAYEELVAELGSVFLGAQWGVESEMRDDHVLYLKGWISALKNDPKMLFKAASDASKAAEFLERHADGGRVIAA